VGAADVWRALLYDGARPGRVAFVGPDWAPVWSPLVAALAMVGVAVIRGPARQRAGLIAAVLLAATIGLAYGQFRDELARFVAWMLAPVAGVGLSWIAGQAPAARRGAVVAALALVLIIAGAASSARPPGIADARLFASRFAESLKALRGTAGPAPLAVVAEDTLVDSAVVAFGGGLHRLPQDADAAAFAWSSGAHVVAGPSARRNLEALGLVFRGVHSIAEPMRFEWSAVIDRHQCAAVRVDRWSLLPGLEFTGRIGLMVPAGLGELRLIVGDSLPVALRAERPDGLPVSIAVETLLTGHAMNLPPPDYWFDGGSPQSAPGEVVRATIAANPMADRIVAVHLGRRSPRVLARLRGYPVGAHGRVCAAPLGPDRLFAAPVAEERIVLEAEPLFGTGWYGFERYGASAFRWGSGDAVVLVPLEKRGPLRVSTRLAPAVATGEPPELVLEVNGIEQARRATRPGLGDYSWDVPARVWVTGVNDLRFHVSRTVRPADQGGGDRRVLGFALHELKLSLVESRQ
jgi:hypothetical protein